jgi:hypothetical protein
LERNDNKVLLEIRSQLSARSIIQSDEPTLHSIKKKVPIGDVARVVASVAKTWVENNGLKGDAVPVEFAYQILTNEPTWTILDVVHFFDFISSHQHDERMKVFGDRITPLRLMEMKVVYEEYKSEERERLHHQRKVGGVGVARESMAKDLKSIMGREMEEVMVRNVDKAIPKGDSGESFFRKMSQQAITVKNDKLKQ